MKIQLPIVLQTNDYHEFDKFKDLLNKVIISDNIKTTETIIFKEIGFDGLYHAYFYDASTNPSNEEIVKFFITSQNNIYKKEKDVILHLSYFEDSDIINSVDVPNLINKLNINQDFFKPLKKKKY